MPTLRCNALQWIPTLLHILSSVLALQPLLASEIFLGICFFSQGYDIEAVLGKQLDAMTCYIIERSQPHGVISFCLEEIKIRWRIETSNFGLEPFVGFVHLIVSTILQHKDDKKPVRFIDKSDSEIYPFNNNVLLQKVLISVLVAWAAFKTNGNLYLLEMVKQKHEYMIRACGPKSWTA